MAELHLFRIAQEAINNIEKHAHARSVDLQLKYQSHSAVLKIQDDGQGFDVKNPKSGASKLYGLGLTNMRERALSLGGECEITSRPTQGTTIMVRVPLRKTKKVSRPKQKRQPA